MTNTLPIRLLGALALPVLAALASAAWYGPRSILAIYAVGELGLDYEAVGTLFLATSVSSIAAMFIGALVTAAGGPLSAVALGLLVAAAATLALPSSDPARFATAVSIAAGGLGVYRPAVFAAAVRWFGRGAEGARTAVVLGVYLGVNAGALAGPFVAAAVYGSLGATIVFVAAAALLLAAAVVALFVFGASFVLPVPSGSGTAEELDGKAVGFGLAVAGVGAIGMFCWAFAVDLQMAAAYSHSSGAVTAAWVSAVNPVVVMLTAAVVGAACVVLQFAGVRTPSLALAGVGLLTAAAGIAPVLLAPHGGVGVLVASSVIGAIGEPLAAAGLISFAAGRVHFRLAAIPVLGLVGASHLGGVVAGALADYSFTLPLAGAAALGCALVGVASLGAAVPLEMSTASGAGPVVPPLALGVEEDQPSTPR